MSVFATDFAVVGWPWLLAQLGESVAYTPSGGSETAVSVVWIEDGDRQEYDADGERVNSMADIQLHSDAITAPGKGDKVVRNSETWYVTYVKTVAGIHTLTLKRSERDTIGTNLQWGGS